MAQAGSADLPDGESEIFLREGLDRILVICPTGAKCPLRHGGGRCVGLSPCETHLLPLNPVPRWDEDFMGPSTAGSID
jgi:hypothetical protein